MAKELNLKTITKIKTKRLLQILNCNNCDFEYNLEQDEAIKKICNNHQKHYYDFLSYLNQEEKELMKKKNPDYKEYKKINELKNEIDNKIKKILECGNCDVNSLNLSLEEILNSIKYKELKMAICFIHGLTFKIFLLSYSLEETYKRKHN